MEIFKVAKRIEAIYEKFLFKLIGPYNIANQIRSGRGNILNPSFLPCHYVGKAVKEYSAHAKGILLDIGCGTKPYYRFFHTNVKSYYGIDIPDSRYSGLTKAKPDIFGDGVCIPIKSNAVNTVFSSFVLEHVTEPDNLIGEFGRVIKNGGVVIILAPQSYPIHHKSYDYYRYTKHGLRYLLEKNGFEVISITQNGKFYVHISEMIVHFLNRRLFRNVRGTSVKIFMGFIKIMLTPFLILFTFLINIAALLLNYLDTEESFTTSYTLLGEKRIS